LTYLLNLDFIRHSLVENDKVENDKAENDNLPMGDAIYPHRTQFVKRGIPVEKRLS